MALTASQKTTLKADIAANTNTINGVQIKNLPSNADTNTDIANWYAGAASPNYWVWRTNVSRSDIYNTISDVPSSWDWTFYKGQSVTEQNAWVQMFMGDQTSMAQLNVRVGIGKIFTAGSSVNRDHAYAVGRRLASRIEKLLAVAVTSPPASTGNDGIAGNRGNTTNPDVMTFEGLLTYNDVTDARNS